MFTTRNTSFIHRTELADDQIRAVAPSVFAMTPQAGVSERYPLIHPDEYQGPDTVPYSYEGKTVNHKGKTFRLGAKTVFAALGGR